MSERLLLHPQANYTQASLNADFYSAVVEAGCQPIADRIYPYYLCSRDNIIFDPQRGYFDVRESVSTDPRKLMAAVDGVIASSVAEKEVSAFNDFCDCINHQPDGSVAIWFSPPNKNIGYSQGRITVGHLFTESERLRIMECYGIATVDQTAVDYLAMANNIGFDNGLEPISDPEQLRSRVYITNPDLDKNPWELLNRYIPLDEVWTAIQNGKPNERIIQLADKLKGIVADTYQRLKETSSRFQREEIIKGIIPQIGKLGFDIDISQLPCAASSSSSFGEHDLNDDNLSLTTNDNRDSSKEGKFIKNCGQCGAALNRMMKKGDHCPHCQGVYQGC